MPVTECLGKFAARIERLPQELFKAEVEAMPVECVGTGCTPGGCRKHCADYARGAWVRATYAKGVARAGK